MHRNVLAALSLAAATAAVVAGCAQPNAPLTTGSAKGVVFKDSDFNAAGVSLKQIVVKLKNSRQLPASFQGALESQDATIAGRIDAINTLVVERAPNESLEQLRARLAKDPAVAGIQPVNRVRLEEEAPNDPKLAEQWSLKKTHALEAWGIQAGRPDVVIAVIDSGIDLNHPDLKAKIVADSYNTLAPGTPPADDHGHGTHCAGIAAAIANNGEGGAGVAPGVGIMSVKVLDSKGGGSDATIAQGITWAADHGAKVMTMSLGLYKRSQVIEDALDYALKKDVVLVASAGNNNKENDPVTAPHLPSTHPGVIEVAATTSTDEKASFSNFGKTVTVAAPGKDILSTLPTYNVGRPLSYGLMSGTSMASPFAAGAAALIRSQFPNLTQAQVKAKLEASVDDLGAPGYDPIFGYGRINLLKAVSN